MLNPRKGAKITIGVVTDTKTIVADFKTVEGEEATMEAIEEEAVTKKYICCHLKIAPKHGLG